MQRRTDPLEIADMLRHAVSLSDTGERIPEAARERMLRAANEMTQPVTAQELKDLCVCAAGIVQLARAQAPAVSASGRN